MNLIPIGIKIYDTCNLHQRINAEYNISSTHKIISQMLLFLIIKLEYTWNIYRVLGYESFWLVLQKS